VNGIASKSLDAMLPILFAPLLSALTSESSPSGPSIEEMMARFAAGAREVRSQGVDPTVYFARLQYLERREANVPAAAPAQLTADLQTQQSLEFLLDERLLSGRFLPPPKPGGAAVRLYASPGKAPDPIGVYVPAAPVGKYALAILLHGMQQTETDVVSRAVFRNLADASHVILVAPYNGGSAQWNDAQTSDLLALIDKMRGLYPIDGRRVYLVGMSMGGASAFHIAARHADRFAAFMTVVGSLDPADAASARRALRDRPVYLVSAGKDPIVTPADESMTYAELARGCVAVAQYIAPTAGHDLYATSEQLERAWKDMLSGVVRSQNTRECDTIPGNASP